ncbi:Uncharacterised protein [Mycobacteroides abscessus subsp. massiliense]|nr:Uncharacterised protein [Mycobacteroides abscessus subsp. massiliense]
MKSHISQHQRKVGQQRGRIGQQVVPQQLEVLDHLTGHIHPPLRVGGVQIPMAVVVAVLVVMIVIVIVQDRRRRCGRRRRRQGDLGRGLVCRHRRGGLNPHADVVRLGGNDGNCVDTEEVCCQQRCVGGVVGGQLGKSGHDRQRGAVCAGSGPMLSRAGIAFDGALGQPLQIRNMRRHIRIRAWSLPRCRTGGGQNRPELIGRRGVMRTQRRPFG